MFPTKIPIRIAPDEIGRRHWSKKGIDPLDSFCEIFLSSGFSTTIFIAPVGIGKNTSGKDRHWKDPFDKGIIFEINFYVSAPVLNTPSFITSDDIVKRNLKESISHAPLNIL